MGFVLKEQDCNKCIHRQMCHAVNLHAPCVAFADCSLNIQLPCKVGDDVWCIRDTKVYSKPVKGVVSEIYFRDNMDMCIVVRRLCRGRWGERIFATEQEAQAAIDRRMNDGKMQ